MKIASIDVDEAREVGGAIYYPHDVRHTTDDTSFSMSIEGRQVGAVLAGTLAYASPVELATDELNDAYQVNVALNGSFDTTRGEQQARLTTCSGAVYGPGDKTTINGWGSGARLLAVKLDRRSVELAAGQLLRRRPPDEISFGMALDFTKPEARDWLGLVRIAMRPDGLAESAAAASSLGEAIVVGLLAIADHPDQNSWNRSGGTSLLVDQAVDFIDLNAHRKLAVTEVAAHVGVCARQLQQLFLEAVAQSPSEFIRTTRLQRVRDALLAADPATTTVSSIASAHEYHHLGRFSVLYGQHFGEAPSHTLRR